LKKQHSSEPQSPISSHTGTIHNLPSSYHVCFTSSPEGEASKFIRNVSTYLQNFMASHLGRPYWYCIETPLIFSEMKDMNWGRFPSNA
jgi:hypothetical protein